MHRLNIVHYMHNAQELRFRRLPGIFHNSGCLPTDQAINLKAVRESMVYAVRSFSRSIRTAAFWSTQALGALPAGSNSRLRAPTEMWTKPSWR